MILLLNVHLSLVVCSLTPYYIYIIIIILYLETRPPEWPLKEHRYVYDHYTLSIDSIVEKVKNLNFKVLNI